MLGPAEEIIIHQFAEETKAAIQQAIKSKRVTKYGAVNSSGRLHDSVEIVYSEHGFKILANKYIENVIYGIQPGTKVSVSAIKSWIQEKPVPQGKGELSIDSLAYLIAKKIEREGSVMYRQYKGSNSGLLDEAINEQKINSFADKLGEGVINSITSEVLDLFETLQTA